MNWVEALQNLEYLYGEPRASGRVKSTPDDFVVVEEFDFEPHGEGEHDWLWIEKRGLSTTAVAQMLAQHAKVHRNAIGYSGLKDRQAVTQQVFTVWRPGASALDPPPTTEGSLRILSQSRHNKKLKVGSHRVNRFTLAVRGVPANQQAGLDQRLSKIQKFGFANYFGSQRFGFDAKNMDQALALFDNTLRKVTRTKKSMLLSAARAWLFNEVVSERIKSGNFAKIALGDWANLDGSGSVFALERLEQDRLEALDIHPTAPMWGSGSTDWEKSCEKLTEFEHSVLHRHPKLIAGLELAGLKYQRRPIRARALDLNWTYVGAESNELTLKLNFALYRGQYATSLLRELLINT
ncbi:MAG: tRNA pseudouridine(13) synthase TruD [Pseudomonadota bacterium]